MDKTLLWLNLGRHLRSLHRPLLRELAQGMEVAQWDYQQSLDEPACLDLPLTLLHDYLQDQPQPVHLAGHGISGVLAILYAQRYPDYVRSLSLLGVGPCLAACWQAHYYRNRWMLTCDYSFVLSLTVSQLFGAAARPITRELVDRLRRDLDETPFPHSLFGSGDLGVNNVPVPLLVCGSQDDVVIDPETLLTWQHLMNPYRGDRIWQCPSGGHFFHYFHPKWVSQVMLQFWQRLLSSRPPSAHFSLGQDVIFR